MQAFRASLPLSWAGHEQPVIHEPVRSCLAELSVALFGSCMQLQVAASSHRPARPNAFAGEQAGKPLRGARDVPQQLSELASSVGAWPCAISPRTQNTDVLGLQHIPKTCQAPASSARALAHGQDHHSAGGHSPVREGEGLRGCG